jgi:Ulp1 family protease
MAKIGRIALSRSTMKRLRPPVSAEGEWLNDSLIDAYMKLLSERNSKAMSRRVPKCHFFTSFFVNLFAPNFHCIWATKSNCSYDHRKIARHVSRVVPGGDIFAFDKLFFPIHMLLHWFLIVVSVPEKMIQCYDSFGSGGLEHMEVIKCFLEGCQSTKNPETWTLFPSTMQNPPQQVNGRSTLF